MCYAYFCFLRNGSIFFDFDILMDVIGEDDNMSDVSEISNIVSSQVDMLDFSEMRVVIGNLFAEKNLTLCPAQLIIRLLAMPPNPLHTGKILFFVAFYLKQARHKIICIRE